MSTVYNQEWSTYIASYAPYSLVSLAAAVFPCNVQKFYDEILDDFFSSTACGFQASCIPNASEECPNCGTLRTPRSPRSAVRISFVSGIQGRSPRCSVAVHIACMRCGSCVLLQHLDGMPHDKWRHRTLAGRCDRPPVAEKRCTQKEVNSDL